MAGQVNHNKNRQYTLGRQDHSKRFCISPPKSDPPSLHATQILRAGQTRHSEPKLFLNPPKMYSFLFSDPLTKMANRSY